MIGAEVASSSSYNVFDLLFRMFDLAPDAANIGILKYTHSPDKRNQIRLDDHPGDVKGLAKDFEKITYNGGGNA